MQRDPILAAVERYYTAKFEEHGATPRGVDWNSQDSQDLRFEQLAYLLLDERGAFSVNDLGCGYGALAEFLERRGFDASYTGYELSTSMVAHARARARGNRRLRFREGHGMEPADYSLASGIFNVKLDFHDDAWTAYVQKTLDDLAEASGRGFAFNMLTSYSDADRRRPDLYYADPCIVFDTCKKRYSRHVALLHDYGFWEFTIIVRFLR
jgi:SAM-dependent methyltransferase